MPKSSTSLDHQATIFGKYLIKQPVDEAVKTMYIQSIQSTHVDVDEKDARLLRFVEKHPSSIGLIDAGLVFYKPQGEVRRRLYFMLAILEASPKYHKKFLPQEHSFFYIFVVAMVSLRAVMEAILGMLLVRAI